VTDAAGVRVRALAAGDLDEADRICRIAFGTFLGVPEPEKFFATPAWSGPAGGRTRAPRWPRNSAAAWPDRTSPRTGGVWASSAR